MSGVEAWGLLMARPTTTAQVAAAPQVAVDSLAEAMRHARLRVSADGPTTLTARARVNVLLNLVQVVAPAQLLRSTALTVTAEPTGGGTRLILRVAKHEDAARFRGQVARVLTDWVTRLRAQGVEVTVAPWQDEALHGR